MIIDVQKIDRQIAFLRDQAKQVTDRNRGASWAESIAGKYNEIAETLRQLRQEKQMTGIGGKQL